MATIKDIAASCKVAVSTVSRVLNDHPMSAPRPAPGSSTPPGSCTTFPTTPLVTSRSRSPIP